jgi:hypothetical protein
MTVSTRLKRLVVLGLVLLGGLAATASASASTVTVSPGGAVTGTAGAARFTLPTARKTINCTNLVFTDTLVSGATGTLPLAISNNLHFLCTGTASIAGGTSVTIGCNATTVLWVTASHTGTSITPVSITGIGCTISAGGSCSVRIGGSVAGSFDNIPSALTVDTTGQSLAATGSTCAALPNDANVLLSDLSGGSSVFTVGPAQTIV